MEVSAIFFICRYCAFTQDGRITNASWKYIPPRKYLKTQIQYDLIGLYAIVEFQISSSVAISSKISSDTQTLLV